MDDLSAATCRSEGEVVNQPIIAPTGGASEAVSPRRCGQAGGLTSTGRPCARKVAEGIQRCAAHRDRAAAIRQRDKKRVLAALGEGKHLHEAAREIKRDPATIWKWRQADAAFDAQVRQFCEDNEDARVAAVEETLYCRIVEGNASATEIIFYLTNRARTRWRNKHSREQHGRTGHPGDQVSLAQLHAIAAKLDEMVATGTVNLLGLFSVPTIPSVDHETSTTTGSTHDEG